MPGMEPPADNILINGHHRSDCRLATDGTRDSDTRTGDSGTQSGNDNNPGACVGDSPFSIRVNRSATVRLRVINHGTFLPFWFSVDNHTLQIVEMDGVEIQPLPTTRLFLYPGQRYSVILTANKIEGNYLIRAAAARRCFDPMDSGLYPPTSNLAKVGFQATEVLSYGNTPGVSPPIGVPWDHADSGITSPWVEECLDLPFDLPQPLRPKSAYQFGERNHHFFEYRMILQDGAYYTLVNEVYAQLRTTFLYQLLTTRYSFRRVMSRYPAMRPCGEFWRQTTPRRRLAQGARAGTLVPDSRSSFRRTRARLLRSLLIHCR